MPCVSANVQCQRSSVLSLSSSLEASIMPTPATRHFLMEVSAAALW